MCQVTAFKYVLYSTSFVLYHIMLIGRDQHLT